MNNYYFYTAQLKENEPSFLVSYCAGSGIDKTLFSNELVNEFKKHIFIKDLVIISPAFNKDEISDTLLNEGALEKLKDKINSLQELNVHTCFIDSSGKLETEIYKGDAEKSRNKLNDREINKLIEYGLFYLAKTKNLILESSANFHFVKPSGKHTDRFISVTNMFECAAEVSFVAANLLKFVPEKLTKIYVDTSGIYSLAHELTKLVCAFNHSSKIIAVDSFGSYGGLENYDFSSDANTLILISATTSNDLYEKLKTNGSLEQAKVVSLVTAHANSSSGNTLIDFKQYSERYCKDLFRHFDSYSESECPLCKKEASIPLALDRTRFLFEAPRTEECLPIATDADSNLKRIMHEYKDLDVFRCLFDGVDGKTNPTPEYFIDVSKLISDSESYKKAVKFAVLRHFPINADCIIHCKDSGAKELACLIQDEVAKLGKTVHRAEGEFTQGYEPKSGIVVVAGSIQTGKSLLNISRYLRKFGDLPITYLVGFAKPNSEAEFKKLQLDLKYSSGPCGNHTFHAIQQLLLPISVHKQHSWMQEIEVLKELRQVHGDDDLLIAIVEERLNKLREASSTEFEGLGKSIFLKSPKNSDLILGKTFAFWNRADTKSDFHHQASVYFTISSVLQRLRTVKRKNGIAPLSEGYIIRQLDPLLFDRFNEGIIQSSVLRAAKARELDYSASDSKSRIIGSLIERMIKYPDSKESEALPEFLLALCTGKLQIKKDHISRLKDVEFNAKDYPVLFMLGELVKVNVFNKGTEASANF